MGRGNSAHFFGLATAAAVVWAGATIPARPADQPVLKAAPAQIVSSGWFDASLDGVYAWRNHSSSAIIEDTVTGSPILTANDLAFNEKLGLDARLRIGSGPWAIEGRFFGGFRWNSSANITTSPIWNTPTNPPLFGLGVAQIDARLEGRFDSWEANLRYQAHPQLVIFAGGRWIKFADDLTLPADFGGNQATISMLTELTAKGVQVGAEVRVFGPGTAFNPLGRVFLDLDGRAAFMRVDGTQNLGVQQAIGPAFVSTGGLATNVVMFELGAMAGIQITRNVELRGGYRYLHFPTAVFAADQFPVTDVITGAITPATRPLVLQAGTFGVRVRL